MAGAEYPFQMIGGLPVVTVPAEIDITTSAQLRATLSRWHSRGCDTVVVDLTGTVYCDMAGLHELELAHKRAAADGGGLRLVTPADGPFMRIFTVTGDDRVIPAFDTVQHALAQLSTAAAGPLRQSLTREPAAAPDSPPADAPQNERLVSRGRRCEQCSAVFVPLREHARFCTSDCRSAWNRAYQRDPVVDASALTWSITAMSDATARLPAMRIWDQPRALAAIGEAVWWITMVDATLIRHHPMSYDTVMTGHTLAERRLIAQTLAGLRFARNWNSRESGLDELIEPGQGTRRITEWKWKPVPEPVLAWLPPRAQPWERARYRAYQACLPGHTVGETFGQAVTFLTLTGTDAASSVRDR